MEIFKLFGSIFVDSKEADKSISSTEKKAEGLGKKLGDGIKTAAKWGAGIAAGAAAGATALFGMATKAAETTDRIDKLSQKIGLSRQGFQEWEFILSQSGTDIEKLQVGLKTLNQRMDEATKESGKGAEAFKQLGLSATDNTGALKNQEQMFEETVRALMQLPEGAEKSQLAFELFGKAGLELMPLLNGTAESIDEMKKMAHDMGVVISDEAVDAGVQFTDTMDQLKRSFGAVVTNVGAAVMPMMQKFAEWIIQHMPEIQAVIGFVFKGIEVAVGIVVDVIGWLIDAFGKLFGSAKENVGGLEGVVEPLKEKFSNVFEGIKKVVMTVFEAIKAFWDEWGEDITSFFTNAWELVSSIFMTTASLIWEAIKSIFEIIKGFWDKWGTDIIAFFQATWDVLKTVFETVFGLIWETVKFLFKEIKAFWDEWGDTIVQAFKAYFQILKTVWSTVFDIIASTIKKVFEGIKKFWDTWGETIITVFKTVFNVVKSVFEGVWNAIKIVVETAIKFISNIINMVLNIIKGDWAAAWDNVKAVFEAVWDGIKKLFSNSLNTMIQIGKDLFNGIWEGMKSIWTNISSWVSEKVSWLTDKLMFWKKSNEEMEQDQNSGSSTRVDGSHAQGLSYVPYDGYIAELHKGERVLTAAENKALSSGAVSPSINNHFIIQNMTVNDDQDIDRIAYKLFMLQQSAARGEGSI